MKRLPLFTAVRKLKRLSVNLNAASPVPVMAEDAGREPQNVEQGMSNNEGIEL